MLAKYRVGCSGWSYKDWIGPFYPKETPSYDLLKYYSTVFDTVEVDSSFYRTPTANMVASWNKSTPEGFTFAAKLPKIITHVKKLEGLEELLARFNRVLKGLGTKLGPIVAQMPPSFKFEKHFKSLTAFLSQLEPGQQYSVEFRNKSWFRPEVYRALSAANVSMCWSVNQYLTTPQEVTAQFLYVRFVGDRSISEFHTMQRDRSQILSDWHGAIEEAGDSVKELFIFFNNHFAGFGPGSVNEFRRIAGLMEIDWATLMGNSKKQKSLLDYGERS